MVKVDQKIKIKIMIKLIHVIFTREQINDSFIIA